MRFLVLLIATLGLWGCSPEGVLEPGQLTCEYLKDPGVVDRVQPRLGWINLAAEGTRGEAQTAWQVRVASSRVLLREADLWDSGRRNSSQSTRVAYEGKPLDSRQECWWQVRVWDSEGHVSPWSEPGWWRMGILHPEEWIASWIGDPWQGEEALPKPPGGPDARPESFGPPAPLLRKEFTLKKHVTSAVAFVTGLGYFELYLNGEKVGEDLLVPNQTNYGKRPQLMDALIWLPDEFREYRVMYLAYDVKEMLVKGENAVGGILGNGFYNPAKFWAAGYGSPRFLCQLHITYSDGSEEIICTDTSWKVSRSPILMNMVYYGEVYDARQEQPGWCTPGFDDSAWEPAVVREAPFGRLVAHTAHPDRVTERLEPVSVEKLGEGHFRVDFGTEISGWVRLNGVDGPEGQRINLKFNGNLYSGDNSYICSGRGPASYAPRFNWFVFSGVEVTNWPGELEARHLTAEAVNTWIGHTAEFNTSNELFNRINTIWQRSQTDNMHGGVASDCPHRERSPYTGDGQVACITVMHNYDARNFYHKWVRDIVDAQLPQTGYVPNGAPWQPGCGGGPAWGAAICEIPWQYYVHYGSPDMLGDSYEAMKGYLRYMQTWVDGRRIMFSQRTARDGSVLKWFNLGEWVAPGETVPDELVHTFYLWYCADITARTAGILGLPEEEKVFRALAEETKDAFHRIFYNEGAGSYGDGGGNILALKMGVPAERYQRVITALKAGLQKTRGHLDTGIIGTRFFFEVLADNGLQEMAYEAMNKRDEPGFGRWVELGSTTFREQWDEGGSHNHPMFGGGLVWFYRNLAGMQADPELPGYRHIVFRPQPVDELEQVTYYTQTSYGRGGIAWINKPGEFTMRVTVPVGCEATVFVPASDPGMVMEGGNPVSQATGVTLMGAEEGYVVFRVVSGDYAFSVSREG